MSQKDSLNDPSSGPPSIQIPLLNSFDDLDKFILNFPSSTDEKVIADIASSPVNIANIEHNLVTFKVLARNPDISDLLTQEHLNALTNIIEPEFSPAVVREAFSILANMLLVNISLFSTWDPATIFNLAVRIYASRIPVLSSLEKYLFRRLGFLYSFKPNTITYEQMAFFIPLITRSLHTFPPDLLKYYQTMDHMAKLSLVELLKVTFNILHHYSAITLDPFEKNGIMIDITKGLAIIDTSNPEDADITRYIFNSLLYSNCPLCWFNIDGENEDPDDDIQSFATNLTQNGSFGFVSSSTILKRTLTFAKLVTSPQHSTAMLSDANFTSCLTCLLHMIQMIYDKNGKNSDLDTPKIKALKKIAESYLLPSAIDRKFPLGSKDAPHSLPNAFVRFSSDISLQTCTTLVQEIYWKICHENEDELVSAMGFGFASGFISNASVLFAGDNNKSKGSHAPPPSQGQLELRQAQNETLSELKQDPKTNQELSDSNSVLSSSAPTTIAELTKSFTKPLPKPQEAIEEYVNTLNMEAEQKKSKRNTMLKNTTGTSIISSSSSSAPAQNPAPISIERSQSSINRAAECSDSPSMVSSSSSSVPSNYVLATSGPVSTSKPIQQSNLETKPTHSISENATSAPINTPHNPRRSMTEAIFGSREGSRSFGSIGSSFSSSSSIFSNSTLSKLKAKTKKLSYPLLHRSKSFMRDHGSTSSLNSRSGSGSGSGLVSNHAIYSDDISPSNSGNTFTGTNNHKLTQYLNNNDLNKGIAKNPEYQDIPNSHSSSPKSTSNIRNNNTSSTIINSDGNNSANQSNTDMNMNLTMRNYDNNNREINETKKEIPYDANTNDASVAFDNKNENNTTNNNGKNSSSNFNSNNSFAAPDNLANDTISASNNTPYLGALNLTSDDTPPRNTNEKNNTITTTTTPTTAKNATHLETLNSYTLKQPSFVQQRPSNASNFSTASIRTSDSTFGDAYSDGPRLSMASDYSDGSNGTLSYPSTRNNSSIETSSPLSNNGGNSDTRKISGSGISQHFSSNLRNYPGIKEEPNNNNNNNNTSDNIDPITGQSITYRELNRKMEEIKLKAAKNQVEAMEKAVASGKKFPSSSSSDDVDDWTEEEKEREAEKMFVMFERLKQNGILKVVNPVEVFQQEGRFENLS